MKATLKFDLNEDREDFEIYLKASDMHCILWDMQEYFMRKYKHESPDSGAVMNEFEECKAKFFELMNERDLQL